MKKTIIKSITGFMSVLFLSGGIFAQTSVYDVIDGSPNHTSLKAAIDEAELDATLQDLNSEFTVFAPDNDAFDDLAAALGTTVAGLLLSPDLEDILLYHVLGTEVLSTAINNGDIVTPLNTANSLKLTVDNTPSVFVNHAQVNAPDLGADNGIVHSLDAVVLPFETVVDVAIDNNFNVLTDAVIEAFLVPALSDPFAEYTVFAPSDAAFNDALANLGISAADLLASADLADILLYHVLGMEVASGDISNGDIVNPLNTANTIKMTVTGTGDVYANQALVEMANVTADNGVVHAIDAVVFSDETVVDVAIDNGFNTLVAAVIEAELLPALTDPFAEYTVFAPSDAAFNDALANLGISAADLLASADLADILLYHVLGMEVASGDISNGDIVNPLNTANTIKMTVTGTGDVYANQALVEMANVTADNGTVHAVDAVIFSDETVVDAAIDNNLTVLTDAVIAAELLPALTDPFAEYTVFAPTDAAFTDLLNDLGITAADLLASPDLADILLYHVVGAEVLSGDLANGPVTTLNGADVVIDLSAGVFVNDAEVITADVTTDNGVVHVIDKVLDPATASLSEATMEVISTYPNPATDMIKFDNLNQGTYTIVNLTGAEVLNGTVSNSPINVTGLENGTYIINIQSDNRTFQSRFVKM